MQTKLRVNTMPLLATHHEVPGPWGKKEMVN